MRLLLYQLADSAFPSGGFAHSQGFEALRAVGLLDDARALQVRLGELAWHTAHAALPFLGDAHRGDAAGTDRACDAFLTGHVANRASRAQGRGLGLAAAALLGDRAGDAVAALPCGHAVVALGVVVAGAGVALDDARELAMFGALRSAVSAAVRLGVVGPLRAQRALLDVAPIAARALAATRTLAAAEASSTAPFVDLVQAAHDRLYARLFQS